MKKLFGNRFAIIVITSVIFTMIMAIGAAVLTKNNVISFEDSGYLISSNKVLEFASGTTYKVNLNEQVVFENVDGNISNVDLTSIIHYTSGNIALLKNGAFVDLSSINQDIVPFYNITKKSILKYSNNGYSVNNKGNDILFKNILLRVSNEKFLVAGENVRVSIPGMDNTINGKYFEVTFIADGIVLIENENDSYQVTAEGSKIFVDDSIVIDLSTQNISYDGKVSLNMSQITIDGNENISIYPEEESESKTTDSTGDSKNEQTNESNNANSNSALESENTQESNQSTQESQSLESESSLDSKTADKSDNDTESNFESEEIKVPKKSEDVSVELVNINVKSNEFEASFQVNNYDKLKENLTVNIKNMSTNEEVEKQYELQDKGLLYVSNLNIKNNFYLTGNTSYYIQVKDNRAVYYQRMFTTNEYGFSLEKVLIGQDEIEYNGVFEENTDITSATIILKDENNNQIGDEVIVTKANSDILFGSPDYNIESNTEYTISVIGYQINGTNFINENGYLNKTVKTLKKAPSVNRAAVSVTNNNEFILTLTDYQNPDGANVKFYYNICLDTDTFCETPIKVLTSDSNTYTLKIGENGIESNKNYRYKAILEYNDNEKIREIITDHSDKFISEGASISYISNQAETTFNTITGQIKISDPDKTVPMPDREDCTGENSFRIHYKVNGVDKYKNVSFTKVEGSEGVFISNEFSLTGLSSNTDYDIELLGNVIKNGEIVTNNSIGKKVTARTGEIQSLKIIENEKELSTTSKPIKLNISLQSNSSDEAFINEIKTMKMALYYINSSSQKVQIGNIVNLDNSDLINNLYKKNYTIDNTTFGIDDIEALAQVATNTNGRLANKYVVKFYDAYDVELAEIGTENSNNIEIENNEISYQIDSYFLLNYYASKLENATEITVQEVKNSDKKNPNLASDTIIGYTINSKVNFENTLSDYFNLTDGSLSYVYKIYKLNLSKLSEANGSFTEKISDINNYDLIKEYPSLKTSSVTFYTGDITGNAMSVEGLSRGETYIFTFQINTSNGKYPQEEIVAKEAVNVTNASCSNSICCASKQKPVINVALAETSEDSISYLYKIISDVDGAFQNYNLSLIDNSNGSIVDTEVMSQTEDYKVLKFTNADFDFTKPLNYTLKYYTKYSRNPSGYSLVGDFDNFQANGYNELQGTFDLNYQQKGNVLEILLNSTDLNAKTDLYQVIIKENNKNDGVKKEFLYSASDVKKCGTDNTPCLVIDYSKLESLIGIDSTVSVTSYYETGKSGLLLVADNYVFKDSSNKYLSIGAGKQITKSSSLSGGIYNYSISNNSSVSVANLIRGTDWNTSISDSLVSFTLKYQKNGASFGDNGIYYPLEIDKSTLTSSDTSFYFSSIIPGITVIQKSKIDEIDINVQLSGVTTNLINNEMATNDKKIYIDVFSDDGYQNKVTTVSKDINTTTPTSELSFEIKELNPDTTYYYQVYANLLNKTSSAASDEYERTLLYDKGTLQVSDRSATTLNADSIMGTIKATYKTTGYNSRQISVVNTLKSTDNFTLKYEVYNSNTSTSILPDKTVSTPKSENTITYTNSEIEDIIYGDAGITGYKIKITAVYASGTKTLELYNGNFAPYSERITGSQVLELSLPELKVSKLTSNKGNSSYNISFTTSVTDLDYVISNSGTYYVRLYDPTDSSVKGYNPTSESCSSCTVDSDGYVALQDKNKTLIYSGLKANTTYIVNMKTTAVRNNASLDEEKRAGEKVVYNNAKTTGNEFDVDLGTSENTKLSISGQNIILEYSDAVKLDNISKISATIFKGSEQETIANATSSSLGSSNFFPLVGSKWKLQIPSTIIKSNSDQVIVMIKYYAKNLSGTEEELNTITYSNFE